MRWQWLDSMKMQNKTICLNMISMEPRSLDSIDPPGKNDNPVWPWPFFILSISVHVFNRLSKARVKKLTANAGWRQWLTMMTVQWSCTSSLISSSFSLWDLRVIFLCSLETQLANWPSDRKTRALEVVLIVSRNIQTIMWLERLSWAQGSFQWLNCSDL